MAPSCIADGQVPHRRQSPRRLTREHYFNSAEATIPLFADFPEALASAPPSRSPSAALFRPKGRKPILPSFVRPAMARAKRTGAGGSGQLCRQAEAGLERRLADGPLRRGFTREDYEKRLAYEVDVITKMKFPGYFLIVADFIQWAKADGIRWDWAPGRVWPGPSTDLDPLRFGLGVRAL